MQVEAHPYYPAEAVKPFWAAHNIHLQAWFPLGHGNADMMHDPVFLELAEIAGVNKHKPFYIVTPESLQRLATTKCGFEE